MQKPHFLILSSDLNTLEEAVSLFRDGFLSAVVPSSLLCEERLHRIRNSFMTLKAVPSYKDSGEVEQAAWDLYKEVPYERVIALEEIDLLRAGRLRDALGLPGQSYESALAFCDKVLMKKYLMNAGFHLPPFRAVSSAVDLLEFAEKEGFPLVIKAVRETENRGVEVLRTTEDLKKCLGVPGLFSRSHESSLEAEAYVEGALYNVNGLFQEGEVLCSWPSVYPEPPLRLNEGREAASFLVSQENPLVGPLNEYAKRVLRALPCPPAGAFHLEVFVDQNQNLILCEIASRVGGKGVNRGWQEAFGIDLKTAFLQMQAGRFKGEKQKDLRPQVLAGELWFPKSRGLLREIRTVCPFSWVKEYQIFGKPGENLAGPGTLAGSPLILAPTEKEMQQRLKTFAEWFWEGLNFSEVA